MSDIFELNRQEDKAAGLPVFRPIKAAEFAQQCGPIEWRIKNLLPMSAELAAIIAPTNGGKSYFAGELGRCIASGSPFAGLKTRKGRVAIVLGEGAKGFGHRLQALEKTGTELPDDLEVIPAASNLIDPIYEQQLGKELMGNDLIILDTLAACGGSFDENSARDVGELLANLRHLSLLTGATVVLVHHTGKDLSKGARGSSALKAALDVEITISGDGKIRTAEVTKARDFETGFRLSFQIEKVSLGVNEDGDEVSSGILRFIEQTHQSNRQKITAPRGKWQRATLEAARRLLWEKPGSVDTLSLISEAAASLPADPSATRDRRKELAARALQELVSHGILIMVSDDRVRLPNADANLNALPQVPQLATNAINVDDQTQDIPSTNSTTPYKGVGIVVEKVGEVIL
jgi:hypothetical protein